MTSAILRELHRLREAPAVAAEVTKVRYATPPMDPEQFLKVVEGVARVPRDDEWADCRKRKRAVNLCLALLESLGYGDAVDAVRSIGEAE